VVVGVKWGEIPASLRMTSVSVVAIMAVVAYLTTFQTDAEAADKWQQHGQQLTNVRVQSIDQQISGYRYQLLTQGLSAAQRKWLNDEIAKLEKLKSCIRKGEC
jgi:hypothetical protein